MNDDFFHIPLFLHFETFIVLYVLPTEVLIFLVSINAVEKRNNSLKQSALASQYH